MQTQTAMPLGSSRPGGPVRPCGTQGTTQLGTPSLSSRGCALAPPCPQGCFDWWGFTSPSYACKLGVQVAGVHSMIDALVAGRIPASTT